MNWYYSLNGQASFTLWQKANSPATHFHGQAINGYHLGVARGPAGLASISAVLPNLTNAVDAPQLGGFAVPAAQKDLLVQQMREGVASTAPGAMHYGGFWIRFVAKFVDGLILLARRPACWCWASCWGLSSASRGRCSRSSAGTCRPDFILTVSVTG